MKSLKATLCGLILAVAWSGWSAAGQKPDHICFRQLDTDRDGMVTKTEFAVHYGKDDETFKLADSNEDGHLTHDEYHGFLGHGREEKEKETSSEK